LSKEVSYIFYERKEKKEGIRREEKGGSEGKGEIGKVR
jgi:hypothetical protein